MFNAIIKSIQKSIEYICNKYDINEVVFVGGVSASEYISKEISKKLHYKEIEAYFTKPEYATDNAIGCALIGVRKYEDKSFRNQ